MVKTITLEPPGDLAIQAKGVTSRTQHRLEKVLIDPDPRRKRYLTLKRSNQCPPLQLS